MDKKKYNLNEPMYIQITDKGWKFLKENKGNDYIESYIKYKKININGEDWYKFQGHEVFCIFPVLMGFYPLFKPTILLDEKSIK